MMNTIKAGILISLLSFSLLAAEGAPFSITGSPEQEPGKTEALLLDNPEVQNNLINKLKQKAVVQWLENYLGSRFASYQKSITEDFGDKYVTDYKVAKVPGQANTLEISGHLDSDALRKWSRISETKEKGGDAIRPVFVFSSNAQSLQSSPRDTLDRTKDWPTAQLVYKELSSHFQKLNTKLTALNSRLGFAVAPTNENDISNLSTEFTNSNYNTVVWVHLSQCNGCTTARMDMYVYSLAPGRLALIKSEDLAVSASALTGEKSKTHIAPFIAVLHEGLEELISDGKLFSKDLTLRIEGIDAYRSYKAVEKDLQRQDFLSQPSLKLMEAAVAEFNVMSNLSAEELAQRIQGTAWTGFKLQAVRVDSNTIVMRYLH